MGHMVDGRFRLVTCGSKSLTPTQQRYSTIELECLAAHFAVSKCSFYLKGCESFTVVTDHRPLEGVFKKDIFREIPNPRLQRIREKLPEFNIIVKWVPGKSHHIADALSRAPLFSGPEEEEELSIDTARTCLMQVVEKNPELRVILDGLDSEYFVEDTCVSTYSHEMKSVRGQLSADDKLVYVDGSRIVLPYKSISPILTLLHASHFFFFFCGIRDRGLNQFNMVQISHALERIVGSTPNLLWFPCHGPTCIVGSD